MKQERRRVTFEANAELSELFQPNIRNNCTGVGQSLVEQRADLASIKPVFPLKWGDCWHFALEYKVKNFTAEVGFFVHFLGFDLNALSAEYAMFMAPQRDVFIAIKPADGEKAAVREADFRVCFMLEDILSTIQVLTERGIIFEARPQPVPGGHSHMYRAELRSPNGLLIELWGVDTLAEAPDTA